jgi:hypothetical protein
MKKKRKQIEDYILTWVKKITGSDMNVNLWKNKFKNMNDKEFDEFMQYLRRGNFIQIIVPPDFKDSDIKISVEKNIKLGKELGYDFFQRLVIGPGENFPKYVTEDKFLILDLPVRRTKQTLEKGVSVAEHMRKIDQATGQPKDESTATRISYPELQVLVGMGMKHALIELMRDRGGDPTTMKLLVAGLAKTGRISQKLLAQYSTGVLSTKTLKAYLLGMHLKSTLP